MNRLIGKVLSVAIGTAALSAVQLSSALAQVSGRPACLSTLAQPEQLHALITHHGITLMALIKTIP